MALSNRTIDPPRPKCKICDLLAVLDQDDADQLRFWLADAESYTHTAIAREINDDEDTPAKVSADTVAKHRSDGH